MHGVDECLSIENCAKMVSFYIAYIEEISSLTDEEDLVSEEADVSEEIETKSDALHAEEDIVLTDDEMAAFQAALSNRGVDQISGEEASQESREEDTSEGE